MRKLASIQEISAIESIPGADFVVKARVMGWDVVVKKGEFEKGSKCVFFEVDSVLPEKEWAEFMRPRKFRVKTIKLRKVLSQGLALPLSIISEEDGGYMGPHGWVSPVIGDDFTEELGVKKYEIPVHDGGAKMGQACGSFPHYVPKTDEIRLQSCLPVLDELKGKPYFITLKCDGTSSTFSSHYVNNETAPDHNPEFRASSRNWAKKDDETNIYWQMVRKYDLETKLRARPGFAIQGEICGPGIQRNRLGLDEIDLHVFNVYNINKREHLGLSDFLEFCRDMNLRTVKVLETGESFDYTLESLLEMARGKYDGTSNNREGIVIRPQDRVYSPTLQGRLSFKVINNDFLLKDED